MGKEDIQQLLVKYVTNQACETEIREVKQWIDLHPENELYFIELYEAWQTSLYIDPTAIDEELAYKKFESQIKPVKKIHANKWYKLAALLFFPVLVYIAVVYFKSGSSAKLLQLSAANGSLKKVTLTDGTLVWLNAGSKLNYDTDFGKKNRTVFLEGEALFDIGHKNSRFPFLVKTKNYTVKDIGTLFNLKAYPDDPFFETTVIKGQVAVADNTVNTNEDINWISVKQQQILKIFYHLKTNEGNRANLSKNNASDFNEVLVSQVDSSKINIYDGWKDNVLVFEGTRLQEIAKVLERKYNVNVTIADTSLQNIKYTGNFNKVTAVNKVFDIIKQNTPLVYAFDGKNLIVNKPGK